MTLHWEVADLARLTWSPKKTDHGRIGNFIFLTSDRYFFRRSIVKEIVLPAEKKSIEQAYREVEVMKSLDHPNIVKYVVS